MFMTKKKHNSWVLTLNYAQLPTTRGGWKPRERHLTTHRIDPQKPGLPHKLPCRSVQVVESRSWIFKHLLTLWQLMLRLVNSEILTSDPTTHMEPKQLGHREEKNMQKWEPSAAVLSQHPSRLQPISGRHPLCSKILLYRLKGKALKKGGCKGSLTNWGFKWHAWSSHPQASILSSLSNAFFLKSTFDKQIKPPETMDRSVRTDLSSHLSKKISAHDCCGK